jgi:DNA repair protein RecO (recombination protein O)
MPTRERSIRVEAVILSHYDWGETDRILAIFTRELGKVRAIAKGARKPHSRKAGHIEPLMRTQLQLARGRELYIVTQAENIDAYDQLRTDLSLLGHAAYCIELLDRFTYEEGENRPLYDLLKNTLKRLSTQPNAMFTVRYYEIRLLDLLGFRPHLFHCASCEKDIRPEDQFFSSEQGGILCPTCGHGTEGARPVTMNALKYLRHFQRSSYREAQRAVISLSTYREMERLMQHYLTYLLERHLNTPNFQRRIQKGEIIDLRNPID